MKPLLTIAIPTYNRAEILDNSLGVLLPQINKCSDYIELVISDNASQDRTQEVISKHQKNYNTINWIVNVQESNTGFFGNFKRCRELATGKYFWLLSDNEQLKVNIIPDILEIIINNLETGVFYLHNVVGHQQILSYLTYKQTTINELIDNREFYRLTLISSVIFANIKDYDKIVYKNYANNIFLGFFLLINALRNNSSIIKITGSIYSSTPATVNCNVFEAWTIELLPALAYLEKTKLITKHQKTLVVHGYLPVLKYQLNIYKRNGTLGGKTHGNLTEIKRLLDKHFESIDYYRNEIDPIFSKSVFRLKCEHFASNVINKIAKSFKLAK
jgi:glycosyltransferase involved in cell wall biosynthesis